MKTLEKSTTAANLFQSIVKGRNFMTPHVIGYYDIDNGAVELTTGDFMRREIFGVTVVKDNVKQDDLSKCCNSLDEAKEYIQSL